MRPELNIIALIEKYLRNELEETDRIEFEKRIENNPEFKKEVELQKELMQGINRLGLQQSIQKARTKYQLKKWSGKLGLGTVIIALIAGTIWYVQSQNENTDSLSTTIENVDSLEIERTYSIEQFQYKDTTADSNATELISTIQKLEESDPSWMEVHNQLPSQFFELKMEEGSILETDGGMIISIGENAFIDANGNIVKGEVELEIEEALDAVSIITAGLSTRSNERMLETGGMFYINARQNNMELRLNPDVEFLIEIPTDSVREGMQLFDGEQLSDGTVNWVNPKPLEKYLTAVDINSLNFYPPNYEKTLAQLGHDISDKAFKDSLLYTFFCEDLNIGNAIANDVDYRVIESESALASPSNFAFNRLRAKEAERQKRRDSKKSWWKSNQVNERFRKSQLLDDTASIEVEAVDYVSISYSCKGIEPASIKAIWNDKFQNTNLATTEFEERLQTVYASCNKRILDLYIKHLDKPLYYVDSIVAKMRGKRVRRDFGEFYKRKDGRVKLESQAAKQLNAYYSKISKVYAATIAKTQRKFWLEQEKLNQAAGAEKTANTLANRSRIEQNFQKELDINLTEAYRQFGEKRANRTNSASTTSSKPSKSRRPDYRSFLTSSPRYRISLQRTGFKNIDRYIIADTRSRRSLNFTSQQGKKAKIEYAAFKAKVKGRKTFDRVYTYLLTDQFFSFMRMKEDEGLFSENLNELIEYKMISVGYKGDEVFIYTQTEVKPKTIVFELQLSSKKEVGKTIKALSKSKQGQAIQKDLVFETFVVNDQKREEKNQAIQRFRNELYPVVFPCEEITSRIGDVTGGRR